MSFKVQMKEKELVSAVSNVKINFVEFIFSFMRHVPSKRHFAFLVTLSFDVHSCKIHNFFIFFYAINLI